MLKKELEALVAELRQENAALKATTPTAEKPAADATPTRDWTVLALFTPKALQPGKARQHRIALRGTEPLSPEQLAAAAGEPLAWCAPHCAADERGVWWTTVITQRDHEAAKAARAAAFANPPPPPTPAPAVDDDDIPF